TLFSFIRTGSVEFGRAGDQLAKPSLIALQQHRRRGTGGHQNFPKSRIGTPHQIVDVANLAQAKFFELAIALAQFKRGGFEAPGARELAGSAHRQRNKRQDAREEGSEEIAVGHGILSLIDTKRFNRQWQFPPASFRPSASSAREPE